MNPINVNSVQNKRPGNYEGPEAKKITRTNYAFASSGCTCNAKIEALNQQILRLENINVTLSKIMNNYLNHLLKTDPYKGNFGLGYMASLLEEYPKAIDLFNEAIKLRPNDSRIAKSGLEKAQKLQAEKIVAPAPAPAPAAGPVNDAATDSEVNLDDLL